MANLLRDDKKTRWWMLIIISIVMFAAYVASDNLFTQEDRLCTGKDGVLSFDKIESFVNKHSEFKGRENELPVVDSREMFVAADSLKFAVSASGEVYERKDYVGYAWESRDFDEAASAYSIFNVYLLMLILGGLILDRKGIRFSGILSCALMVIGVGLVTLAFFAPDMLPAPSENVDLKIMLLSSNPQALWTVLGIGIYGVGAEIAGITATKAIAKWFVGYEMAMAMGLQLAIARLGTGLAYGATPFVVNMSGSVGVAILIGLILLAAGLLLFMVYCVKDKKLDAQLAEVGYRDESADPEDEFHFSDIFKVFKSPAFWMIALLCVLFYGAVNPFLKFSSKMMTDRFGVDESLAGLIPSILPFGCIILSPIFGGIYDKKGHGADLMILGAVLLVLVHGTFAVLPASASPVIAVALMVILGIAYSLLPSAMWPSIAKIMPAKLLGTTMALTFWLQNIGFLVVPKAKTAIMEAYNGDYVALSIFFTCLGVAAIVLAFGLKVLDKKKHYGLQEANIKD